MRGSAWSMLRITSWAGDEVSIAGGNESLVVSLALILASVLTRRYGVTVLTS